jgi:iron complex transport system substrate-binding protein
MLFVLLLFVSAVAQAALPPSRVVVLEFSLLDETLALGVTPVGIASNETVEGSNPAYLQAMTKNIPSVGTRQQPSLEKILSLKPDLIIADQDFQGHLYKQLKVIAPTVVLNGILGTPQQQMHNLLALGKIFHKEKRAKQIVAKFEHLFQRYKKEGRRHKGTVLIGFAQADGLFNALTRNAIATNILASLGKTNLIKQYAASQAIPVSVEKMLAENPDAIVLLVTNNSQGIAVARRLTENPLWSQLKAVKEKHVYLMSRNLWAIDHGVEAMTLMLKQAAKTGFIRLQPQPLTFSLAAH